MAELRVHSLAAGYGRRRIVSDISLTLAAGKLHALLGPNGAGKTTLLRVLAGILPPSCGRIIWASAEGTAELTALTARQRASFVAYVPQLASNDVPLTVGEAIQIAARGSVSTSHRSAELRSADTLELLGLSAYAAAPCASLSGGLWRRVLLAQGLAQGAPVLLLDEPTAYLDPPSRVDALRLLRNLAEAQGLCAVCVLHDPQLALEHAHTASCITAGRLLASGPVAQVINSVLLDLLYASSSDLPQQLVQENSHAS